MRYLPCYNAMFSPFYPNHDKCQSPFSAECDKSTQPSTAHIPRTVNSTSNGGDLKTPGRNPSFPHLLCSL